MGDKEKITCPCCGYKVHPPDPEFSICPICFWEYDYYQNHINLIGDDSIGPNNGIDLKAAQNNFKNFGVCDLIHKGSVRPPNEKDYIDPDWALGKPFPKACK